MRTSTVLALWTALGTAAPAAAQTLLHDLPVGGPVGWVGDLDGDGLDEFLVDRQIFSGADASLVLDLSAVLEEACDATAIGDLNGDGKDDLAFVTIFPGALNCNTYGPRVVTLVSGADGSVLGGGPQLSFQQVTAIGPAGDASGDGILELAWTSQDYINGCPAGDAGFHQLPPLPGAAGLAVDDCWAVAPLGDVSGDGLPDTAIAAGFCTSTTDIVIASNAGGVPSAVRSRTIQGENADGLAAVGDLDGDGLVDLAAVDKDFATGDFQRVRVFSGADLSVLLELPGAGIHVGGPGDIDCDGTVDVFTSGPGSGTHIWSGADGSSLWSSFEETAPGLFTSSRMAGSGNANGDGSPDWIVSFGTHTQVWTSDGPPVSTYCSSKTNSQGCVPFVQTAGFPSATSAQPFFVTARMVLNQKNGLLFYGTSGSAALPWLGGTLCVQPGLQRTPVQSSFGNPPPDDCSGAYAFDLNGWIQSGSDPALVPGATVNGQFWSRDPAQLDGTGVGLTDACEATVCP